MPSRPADLRQACLDEARRILAESGPEKLSLRTVARRIGVSHQAPYKHFANKDAVIAALAQEAYADFAASLQASGTTGDPAEDLARMGVAYVRYGLAHPAEYRLMFGTPLPGAAQAPELVAQARASFDLLRQALRARQEHHNVDHDALFIWSALHGLVGILQQRASGGLTLMDGADDELVAQVLARIGVVLDAAPG